MSAHERHRRVLAVHPASRGFGYAVFESPRTLVDWGVKSTRRDKARQTLEKVTELLWLYGPEALILEDSSGSRRGLRVEQPLTSLKALALLKGVKPRAVSKGQVRNVFLEFHAQTREQIAIVLADRFPELAPWLPRHRKPYMSDDYRMAALDAAALAFTYIQTRWPRNNGTPASASSS